MAENGAHGIHVHSTSGGEPRIKATFNRVEVYGNSGDPIRAGIIRSITEAITNQIATGNIALAAVIWVFGGQRLAEWWFGR